MVVHAGAIPSHIVTNLTWRQESQRERISTGIDEVNSVIEGCPPGGFGIIALDLCDVEPQVTRRIPLSWWFRFRRAIENTPCVLIVLGREPNAKACASLLVEMQREAALFKGANGFQRLDRARFQVTAQKPPRPTAAFEARALE